MWQRYGIPGGASGRMSTIPPLPPHGAAWASAHSSSRWRVDVMHIISTSGEVRMPGRHADAGHLPFWFHSSIFSNPAACSSSGDGRPGFQLDELSAHLGETWFCRLVEAQRAAIRASCLAALAGCQVSADGGSPRFPSYTYV